MKFLLWIALFFIVMWFVRKAKSIRSEGPPPPFSRGPEEMVKCAHCGVNQPLSESILSRGNYFCCSEHRRLAETRND